MDCVKSKVSEISNAVLVTLEGIEESVMEMSRKRGDEKIAKLKASRSGYKGHVTKLARMESDINASIKDIDEKFIDLNTKNAKDNESIANSIRELNKSIIKERKNKGKDKASNLANFEKEKAIHIEKRNRLAEELKKAKEPLTAEKKRLKDRRNAATKKRKEASKSVQGLDREIAREESWKYTQAMADELQSKINELDDIDDAIARARESGYLDGTEAQNVKILESKARTLEEEVDRLKKSVGIASSQFRQAKEFLQGFKDVLDSAAEFVGNKEAAVKDLEKALNENPLFKNLQYKKGKQEDGSTSEELETAYLDKAAGSGGRFKGAEVFKHLVFDFGDNLFAQPLDTIVDEGITIEDAAKMGNNYLGSLEKAIEKLDIGGRFAATSQPALNFLLDPRYSKDGNREINKNVAMAIVVGGLEGFLENMSKLDGAKDSEGNRKVMRVEALGTELGRRVLMNLGIKEPSTADANALVYKRLHASFGNMALGMLVESGVIKDPGKYTDANGELKELPLMQIKTAKQTYTSVNGELLGPHLGDVKNNHLTMVEHKQAEGPTVYYVDKLAVINEDSVDLKGLKGLVKALESVYGESEGKRSMPSREPGRAAKKVENKNRDVPGAQQVATEILANQGMKMNSGWAEIRNVLKGDRLEVMKKLVGGDLADYVEAYMAKDTGKLGMLTFDERQQLEGKMIQVKNILDDLDMYETMYDADSEVVYQDWFSAVQDRMHLGTTSLNYMEDKNIVRWLLAPEAWSKNEDGSDYTVNKDEFDNAINELMAIEDGDYLGLTEKQMEYWAMADAIVQAFEGATIDGNKVQGVDKEHPRYSLEMVKVILNASLEDLRGQILESSHMGHAALAVANIERYQQAQGEFFVDLYGEVDGKTNGVFHRLYQFGDMAFLEEFGELVGVSTDKDSQGKTLREHHEKDKRAVDVYVKVGIDFVKYTSELAGKVPWLRGYIRDVAEGMQGDVKLLAKELWSDVRVDVKDPTMVSMYGAGIESLYDKFMINLAEKVAGDIIRDPSKLGIELTPEYLNYLKGEVSKRSVKDLLFVNSALNALFTGHRLLPDLKNKEDSKKNLESYQGFAGVFNKHFARQFEIGNAVTTAYGTLFKAVAKRIQKDINNKRLEGEGLVNRHFLDGLMKEYKNLLPGVAGIGVSYENGDSKLYFYKERKEGSSVDGSLSITLMPVYGPREVNGKAATDKQKELLGFRSLGDSSFVLSSPGASPGPIMVHSLDSGNLALLIIEAQAMHGMTVMPMHDALIRPPRLQGTSKMFNRIGHELNTSFSYLENIITELEEVNRVLKGVYNEFGVNIEKPLGILKEALEDNLAMRDRLLESEVSISQMDGVPGSAYLDADSAAFSSKEDIENLQKALLDEETRDELMKGVKRSGKSLLQVSKEMAKDQETTEKKEGIIGLIETLRATTEGKRALMQELRNVLGKKEGTFEELFDLFKKGCGL